MSEEKNLNDDLNDMLGDAKDGTKKAADKAEEKTKDFANEAKETASEFKESAKETFASTDNKKILAGVLAIVFGWLGVHKFILGYNKEGAIMAVVGVVGWFLCGIPTLIVSVIGLIEGIMYLTKSDAEFYNTYQVGKKPWF